VERDVLADAVAWAARSLPARPPVPVLAGLMLDAADGRLVLSSFDYEVSARVEVPAEVTEAGAALVRGRLLADISRSLPSRPVDVATDASKVVVTCGSSRFTLLTLPVEDYPALPEMPGASGSLHGDAFAAAVAQVSIAAGRDDTLPVLTGVRLEIEGSTITMAATDRYRLAVRELAWSPEQTGLEAIALVPARTLADTAKALANADKVTVALATPGAGEVTLEAGSGDEAQASESLPATLDGDDISIAFNPAYLLDGLGALGAEHAELRFTAPTRPAVLAGKDSAEAAAGDAYRYLLMPVRLSG
jgi:DNA polymerase-3 subunit beta